MKIYLAFSILLIAVSGIVSDKYNKLNHESSEILFCPEPPLFSEIVNIKSSGNDNANLQYWKESIIEKISKDEYNISFSEEFNAYQSPNRANNIRFIYHKDGFTARPRSKNILSTGENDRKINENKKYETKDDWSIQLRVNDDRFRINEADLIVAGNKAHVENENMRIDYTNNEEGMRQDFIIKKKPEGEGKLILNLSAETKLNVIIGADALMLKDKDGKEVMKYSALKCWDANGKELRAYFKETDELQNADYKLQKNREDSEKDQSSENICNLTFEICNLFQIVVNDEDAVYPVTIDPLSIGYSWEGIGPNNSFGRYGASVSTAGDVNGDGYSDIIVGAYSYDNGFTDEGLAMVYYGSATGLSTTSAWSKEGDDNGAFYGWSVSTAGDVNGDGYSDIIVGARFYNGRFGAAFVYHGSASGLSGTPDWTKQGSDYNGYYGNCVSTAGDVNGDGYSDVIVSGPYESSNYGQVFLYKGSASGLSTTASTVLTGSIVNGYFGGSISTAGDVNGDGYSDIIVGAQGEGKAYVYKGANTTAGLNSTPVWSYLTGGISVSTAGDVNGDGYSDIIVGSPEFNNGESNEGIAQLFYGNSSGVSSTPAWSYESNFAGAKFGFSVMTAGDVNGDGYADVIIGAPEYKPGLYVLGRIYAFYGSSSGLGSDYDWDRTLNFIANPYFGYSVCTAGDVNGDGYSDVIAGAPFITYGVAYVYNGYPAGLDSSYNWSGENNQAESQLGYSVSLAGDVNGDGYADVIAGAPFFDNGNTDEGRAYVYYGSSTGISASPDWTKEINEDSAQFGFAVSTAGDINGDGYSDVIVSANLWNGSNYNNQGRAWVYNGSSTGLSSSASWDYNPQQDNAQLGSSVSTAGDVNGDGYSDIIVGAENYNSGETEEGKVFVFYGSSLGLTPNPVWTAEGNQANAHFGNSVSTAGDVDGDRYSDIIIGALDYDNGQSNEGAVFMYHGSASGLPSSANVMLEVNQDNAQFGISVSTAGDVNADSYSDIIVGADLYDNGENNEGRAFVFNGSSTGISLTPSITLEINQADAKFGQRVSTAGDVNGDGYSDVIISAPDYENGQTNEGRVYLSYGSPTGIPGYTIWNQESDQGSARFGSSITTAGDVNGDGYSDIVIGSRLQNNGQSNEGRIFAFYGNLATCKRANTRQFRSGTSEVVCSGNFTGDDGTAKLQIYANTPYGRSTGKIVYERKRQGIAFSGSVITNSTESTGSGSNSDLTLNGKNISLDISGLNSTHEFKWRARVQYKLTDNPYQKFGPWRYYRNYIPVPSGDFKPKAPSSAASLTLTTFIQGFYNQTTDQMTRDTVTVYVREFNSPFSILDSSKFYLNSEGTATNAFTNPMILNGVQYYLQVSHRNSIETWNNGSAFVDGQLNFNFTTAVTQSFGNNMTQVDNFPIAVAFFGGDVNQDGVVDASDNGVIDNDAANFSTGYINTDLTGDDFVDAADAAIADNNAAMFVTAITP